MNELDATKELMRRRPVAIITIGMAGSGKTTFVQRMNSYLHSLDPPKPPYIVNLDPAVTNTPFDSNIDIRDTVNYKEVMSQYVVVKLDGCLSDVNEFVLAKQDITWVQMAVSSLH